MCGIGHIRIKQVTFASDVAAIKNAENSESEC